MRLNDAKPQKGSRKRSSRLGRGIAAGQGASAGKGMRGQKARSGSGTRPGFEGGQQPLYRRVPKLKGFPLINRKVYTTVNVSKLAALAANTEVNVASLIGYQKYFLIIFHTSCEPSYSFPQIYHVL